MFLETDKFDRLLYRDMREVNPGIPELEDAGKEKLKVWPETVSDIWSGLFKADPKMTEDASGPLAKALQEVMETQEWKNLRNHTRLDDLGSAIGTVTFGKDFLENLPPEVLEAEQAEQEAQAAAEAMAGMQNDPSIPQNVKDKVAKMAAAANAKAQAAAQAAQAKCGDVAQAVRVAARQAARQAQQDTADAKALSAVWGDGSGSGGFVPLKEQLSVANKINRNETMKRLVKMFGRLKRLAQGAQARKVERCPEEIVDVETGRDLKSVLPSQFSMLANKSTRLEFYRQYSDGSLLQYRKTGTDNAGNGPVIVMIDESGSMSGDRIVWAKAVGLAMAWVARQQKRDIWLGGFSSGGQVWATRYPGGVIVPAELERFMNAFFSGGTDYDMALSRCVEIIEEAPKAGKKADVLFISDGECYINDKTLKKFQAKKSDLGFRVFSVCVGASAETFKLFSDSAYEIGADLSGDDVVLERVFGI